MSTASPTAAAEATTDAPFVPRQRLRGPAWFLLGLPILPVVLLRLVEDSRAGAFTSPSGTLAALGILAGLVGYVWFAISIVLAARIPAVERLFGSLDRLYRFHRRLGAAVAALLAAHVVLLLASVTVLSGPSGAMALLRPDDGWRVFAGVLAAVALAVLLAVTVVGRLRHESFLRVHRLLGVVYLLGAAHALRVPAFAGQSAWLNGYLVAVTVVGAGAWLYRSGLGRTLVPRHDFKVAAIRQLHPSVVELTLEPMGPPLSFDAGQLVFIGISDDAVGRELHPFSITSAVGEQDLRLVVKAVGDFTAALPEVSEGSWVRVEGPYGGFWHDGQQRRRQVWIAGGIGITPFLSIARSADLDAMAVDFFYCVEDADAALFLDELYAIADAHPRLRVIPVRADDLGFLTADDVVAVVPDVARTDVYLCGPPAMTDALVAQLTARGVPRERLHYEDFRMRGRSRVT